VVDGIISRVKSIVEAGILVIGHLGLTPQSTQTFGGYRVQGKTKKSFEAILEDSIILQESGVCALLLEAMPSETAGKIASHLDIPVLGIGAGNQVDGQLVIIHDLLGLYKPFRPQFAKCYVSEIITDFETHLSNFEDIRQMGIDTREDGLLKLIELALNKYVHEVKSGKYPDNKYSYQISEKSIEKIKQSSYW